MFFWVNKVRFVYLCSLYVCCESVYLSISTGLAVLACPDIELRGEGSTASPLCAPAWSCLLNYTSVQPWPFLLSPSLLNLIRESAESVCDQLMRNQF